MNDHPPICDYEGSDYQTSFWDEGGRIYEDQVEAVALRRLLPSAGKNLLEIGAGAGRNTPRYHGFERIFLLDYSLSQMQQAQSKLGRDSKYIFAAGDVYRLPFVNGLFNCATMIRVIHHLTEPSTALAQIRRVMAKNGIFILEYANKMNLKAILRYIFGAQDWNPFTREPVEFIPLNFNFHPKDVRTLLKAANFNLERQLTVSHFRINFIKKIVPIKLLVWMDSLFQFTGKWWQLTPSVFTKSTSSGSIPYPEAIQDAFFQCPKCKHVLSSNDESKLVCNHCGAIWPIVDGIYDFREKG
jgi:ubiquinone/menaquinone biosynthesis C-methylase UbiE